MHNFQLEKKYHALLTLCVTLLFHVFLFVTLFLLPLYKKKIATPTEKDYQTIDLVFDPPTSKTVAELKQGPSTFGENEDNISLANQQTPDTQQHENTKTSEDQGNQSEEKKQNVPNYEKNIPNPLVKPEESTTTSNDISSQTKTILEQSPIYDQATHTAYTKSFENETPPAPNAQTDQDKKPRRSIIAMTRGYLDSIDYGGHDAFNRQGDSSIKPDFEDVKWISYKKKIFWEINKTLRFLGILQQPSWHGCSSVRFKLDGNGHASAVTIDAQSGSGPCDKMALKIIKTASPFPPIPKHLDHPHLDIIIRFRRESSTFIAEMQILNS